MADYNIIKQILEDKEDNELIVLAGHLNPDMDSIGSSLALARFLNKINKNAVVLLEKKNYKLLEWFNDYKYIINDLNGCKEYTFILLDSNEKTRLGIYEKYFDEAKHTIQIDHHENNDGKADHILAINEMSSTCEIVFNILKLFNTNIDSKIASLLYAGIVTDTKRFSQRITAQTMLVASKLIDYGIAWQYITKETCLNTSFEEAKLLSHVISDLKFDKRLCYVIIDSENKYYKNIEYNTLTKFVAPFIQNINNTEVILLIYKDIDKTIINIRSNCEIKVAKLAESFGGGGHTYASGAIVNNITIDAIINKTKEYIDNYKN